jgi:ElaB/YqjD/DUF883 family membrane-anchored ribosome-binding protein
MAWDDQRITRKETAMSATLATAAGNGAGRTKDAVGTPFDELFDGVDDLIRRVADVENPEIRKIRARVHASMVAAKGVTANGVATADGSATSRGAFEGGANHVPRPAMRVADHADTYLRDYSGQALGVALLVGIGVGLIVSSRQ